MLRRIIFFSIFTGVMISCQSQNKKQADQQVGGPCEGCEALYEYEDQILTKTDTLPGFEENEPKLKISGTVYEKDGKTPAENIILYIYQTNRKGIYETKGNEKGWARRHGIIRGWVRTNNDGRYTFVTFRPGSYPDRSQPEHIHITVKEAGKSAYYIDEFVFSDDPLLTDPIRNTLDDRGGSGVLQPTVKDGILTARRDIILGLNIPDYE